MSSQAGWFETPDVLLDELRRNDLVFRRSLDIPGYDDARELARGGQGVVYVATQRSTHRRVAIKILHEDARGLAARRLRFEREIELVSRLQHPGIVRVYDSGVTSDGRLFIVMEYIEGGSMVTAAGTAASRRDMTSGSHTRLTSVDPTSSAAGPAVGTWLLRRRLELFTTICEAVHFAHQRAVLHRDLKPGNILIDAAGRPHILDFGVARPLAAPAEPMTQAGQFLGTLAYAAPEQIGGESGGADVRSDVYALGVILYELLAGRPPYDVAGPLREAIRTVTELLPLAPGRCVPGCGSGADTDAIVLKALAKEKERRYQSAEALADDVRRALAGEPVEARRGSRWYVFEKTVSRHRWAIAAAAAFVVLLGGWGVREQVLGNRVVAERDQAQAEAAKFRGIVEMFDDAFYALKDPTAGQVTLRELLDETRKWCYPLKDEVRAAAHTLVGNWYRDIGAYADAEELLQSGLAINRGVFGDPSAEVARSQSSLGLLRQEQGDLDAAERLLREALDTRRQLFGDVHVDVAHSLGNLALLLRDKGELEEAEQLLREQLRVRRTLIEEDDPGVALSLYNVAEVLQAAGRIDDAEHLHREALTLRERLLNPGHPDLVASCIALGQIFLQTGRSEKAESQLRACSNASREHLTVGHPRRIDAVLTLARCLAHRHHPAEARALLMAEWADGADASAPAEVRDLLTELDSGR